jgi:Rps23 Pro-64 3,4-dihydroxylase Tpa1-like proline 4-hydroxylase
MLDLTDTRISVSAELKEHYEMIIKQRNETLDSQVAEDRDKAAILRVTSDILKDLVKIQEQAFNAEKFAILQQVVITVLKDYDAEIHRKVVELFEEQLKNVQEI